jgi:hypothetical protein
MNARPEFLEIARCLVENGVKFILVGGVAAIVQGAPVSTFDLDIVIDPTDAANGALLLGALESLDARYLDLAGRHLLPTAERLATLRIHRLVTKFGVLDILTAIGKGRRYTELLAHTSLTALTPGLPVRILHLSAIIQSKEEAGREKDLAALPVLRRTLELSKRPG